MPHIFVKYRPDLPDFSAVARGIEKVIRFDGTKFLSVEEWPLSREDFSFTFLPAGEFDSLIHDIEIIIMAHAFDERVEAQDQIASILRGQIQRELEAPSLSVSVTLLLGQLGYSSSKPEQSQGRRYTDAYYLGQGTPGP